MSLDSPHSGYGPLGLRIGGQSVMATPTNRPVFDPSNGRILAHLPCVTPALIDEALSAAEAAFPIWRATPPYRRSQILRSAAADLRSNVDGLAVNLTLEQGKPLAEARLELLAAADLFEWFAEEGRRVFGHTIPGRSLGVSYAVSRQPIGPVAAFAPWNFPATAPARKIAAALAAGCTMVLKAAEETPSTALAMADALARAGLPPGVLNLVFGDAAQIAEHLIASPVIRKVSLTGSTRVGRILGALAAEHVKPATMELGGHAPVMVFADADIERAAKLSAAAKFRNAGQVCVAPTRFIVARAVYARFHELLCMHAGRLLVGPGVEPSTGMGPLAHDRRLQALTDLIDDAVDRGASVWRGEAPTSNSGYYMAPVVLKDVPREARIMNEEPFGPVAILNAFDDEVDAITEANRLPYGLAAFAFTLSGERLAKLGSAIEAGMIGLNSFNITVAETPFGGVKDSGFGSEGGREGLDAYLTTRLVSTDWQG